MSNIDVEAFDRLDAIVVGGGIAGLAAAMALKGRRVALLETEERVGGRLLSRPAGDYWLNFGAHMIGGPGSRAGDLISRFGLTARPIRGRLIGLAYRGRRFMSLRPYLYPLILPLSARERLSFCRMGFSLRLGTARFVGVDRRRAGETEAERLAGLRDFENHRTLSDFIGPLDPEITTFLRALTERTGADPSEMSAGHGLRSFANVWSRQAPGRNLIGGSSRLADKMLEDLDADIRTGCRVIEVADMGGRVRATYVREGSLHRIEARAAIIATPAETARAIVSSLPPRVSVALSKLRAGPFLTAAILTDEMGPMPWDGVYATATPHRSFSVMFNMATTLRTGTRRPGGSLMLFRGARGAADLMQNSDRVIEQKFLADLFDLFPEAVGKVREFALHRWEVGAPFSIPGSAAIQADLEMPQGRVVLAGDYLDFPNIESAVTSGASAAETASKLIDANPRKPANRGE